MASTELVPVSVRSCGHVFSRGNRGGRCYFSSCFDREETRRARNEGRQLTMCRHPRDYADNVLGKGCVHYEHENRRSIERAIMRAECTNDVHYFCGC